VEIGQRCVCLPEQSITNCENCTLIEIIDFHSLRQKKRNSELFIQLTGPFSYLNEEVIKSAIFISIFHVYRQANIKRIDTTDKQLCDAILCGVSPVKVSSVQGEHKVRTTDCDCAIHPSTISDDQIYPLPPPELN